MQYQSHITLPNDVQATTELGMFVDEVCENVGFDMSTTFKLNLAIEEAVVNVMSYAVPRAMLTSMPKPTMNNSSLLSATAAPPSTLHKRAR